jgi:hypothetical protein
MAKTNSLQSSNFWYLATIHIDLIQIRPNSLGQTKYQLPRLTYMYFGGRICVMLVQFWKQKYFFGKPAN